MIARIDDLLDNIYWKRNGFYKLINQLGGNPTGFEERMQQTERRIH